MSNIEIVRLKACIRQVFEVERGKEWQMYGKAFGKKQMFMSMNRILCQKPEFCVKSRLFLKKT